MSLTSQEMLNLMDAIVVSCRVAEENALQLLSIPLSKAIFLSDRETYFSTGRPLIADAYIRGKYGPYLKELREASDALVNERFIAVTPRILPEFNQHVYEYTLGSNASHYSVTYFTEDERKLVAKNVINVVTDTTPLSAAMATHNHAWMITQDKEHIPLAAQILADPAPINQSDRDWARSFVTAS